jgi:hypothetical protein
MGVVGEPGISSKLRTVHVASPHDWPDGCSTRVTVDMASGRAIEVEGNPIHPVTRGIVDGDYCAGAVGARRRAGTRGEG